MPPNKKKKGRGSKKERKVDKDNSSTQVQEMVSCYYCLADANGEGISIPRPCVTTTYLSFPLHSTNHKLYCKNKSGKAAKA